jgi:hypothetical protein
LKTSYWGDQSDLKWPLIAYEANLLGFIKFAVNPLLNSVGCHAHEVRVRLAGRNCFVDLELPFPQSRFHLRDGEFNTSAVHLCSPPDMPSRATQSPILPNPVLKSDRTHRWPGVHKRSPSFGTCRYGSVACDFFHPEGTNQPATWISVPKKKTTNPRINISGKWKVFLYIGGAGPAPA